MYLIVIRVTENTRSFLSMMRSFYNCQNARGTNDANYLTPCFKALFVCKLWWQYLTERRLSGDQDNGIDWQSLVSESTDRCVLESGQQSGVTVGNGEGAR